MSKLTNEQQIESLRTQIMEYDKAIYSMISEKAELSKQLNQLKGAEVTKDPFEPLKTKHGWKTSIDLNTGMEVSEWV